MRVPDRWPLLVVLLAVGATAAALAAVGAAAAAASLRVPHSAVIVGLGLLIGWWFVGVGLFAWWRRPDQRVGVLMTAVGFAWFAGGLWLVHNPLLHTAGLALTGLYYAVLAHMLLAFPAGRLTGRVERRMVMAMYLVAILGALAPLPFLDSAAQPDCACAANLLLVRRDDRAATALLRAPQALGVVLLLAVTWLLVRRLGGSSRPQRRALAPVLWAGAALTALSGLHLAADTGGAAAPLRTGILMLMLAAMVAVPSAFLIGLARTRFFQVGAVSALVARVAGKPGSARLRDALAAALGDEQVEVLYWLPDRGCYGDEAGHLVALPDPGGARAVAAIERNGMPVGAVVYDAILQEEPQLVRSVTGAVALAMDNQRLQAELRARILELERSRDHAVQAGEAERRRLERDLHDGAQQRLVAVRVKLGLARAALRRPGSRPPAGQHDASVPDTACAMLDSAVRELDTALAELRELARGLHPAVLANRGLAAAVRSLAARCTVPVRVDAGSLPPQRLPGPVESAAYFVVAESLANVAKHARAGRAEVRLAGCGGRLVIDVGDDGVGGADPAGSGLQGLAARVAALDGRISVASKADGGTVVHAEIPLTAATQREAAEGRRA